MKFQENLIKSMLHSWASTAYLMFDGKAAYRAVVEGKIKGFKSSNKVVDPATFEGAMFDILPEIESKEVKTLSEWMTGNPELCEQFRVYYRPENATLASGTANVLSQM